MLFQANNVPVVFIRIFSVDCSLSLSDLLLSFATVFTSVSRQFEKTKTKTNVAPVRNTFSLN